MIKIRVFRAIDDIESCLKYVEGHIRVLKVFGITMITSAKTEWFYNPNTYVIIAESEDKKVLGGARLQIAKGEYQLPIETAVTELDGKITEIIRDHAKFGTGEICGLWNSREVAGMGIGSIFLTRVGVAIADFLNLTSLFALCAPATVPNALKAGFVIETSIGNNGTLYYPKDDLIATVVLLKDVPLLSLANYEEKESIFSLRKNPRQTTIKYSPKGEIKIEFDLIIPF
jgi:hypothetical protein